MIERSGFHSSVMRRRDPTVRRLLHPLLIVLATIFLIEAWLWDHLQPVVARLVALIPFAALKRQIGVAIDRLPPPATLVVFVVPLAVLFPLKIAGLWLLAHGAFISAVLLLLFAKVIGVGVTAFVFDATRDKLLQMAWFRLVYHRVMAWRDWAHALLDPIKLRIRRGVERLLRQRTGGMVGLLRRLRRMRRRPDVGVRKPI
ncbi:MAG TPA: hypothetical protein VNR11_14425 [Xanthobacteraceae bacterium]|nr:hypothetical protein [Xanthobacteraceae bacterium]